MKKNIFIVSAVCLLVHSAWAAQISVTPLKLDLGRNQFTTITIMNNDNAPADLELEAMSWSQNQAGEDHYIASSDLSFYPRKLTLPPNTARIIRVSTVSKEPRPATEASYRLYITELSPPVHPTKVNEDIVGLRFRFGLPVFVHQPSTKAELTLVSVQGEPGFVNVKLNNNGNAHAHITAITSKPVGIQIKEINHTFILANGVQTYRLAVPEELCHAAAGKVDLQVREEKGVRSIPIDLPGETCSAK